MNKLSLSLAGILLACACAFAQATVGDNRSAPVSYPFSAGYALPGACGVSQSFYLLSYTTTGTLYICDPVNVWTVVKGSGVTLATFASPPSSPTSNSLYLFNDASATGTCTGGGADYALCVWNGAAWVPSAGTGSTGSGYLASSATSLVIATGSTTFTTQSGLAYSSGSLDFVSICSSGTPSACFYGNVTSYSGATLVVNVTSVTGTGTHADWLISVAGGLGPTGSNGTNGSNGSNGAGYTATSATSLPIATGSTTFTTQAGLAYTAGALSYAVACSTGASTACFFGNVTSYSGTTLVVNVTSTTGSGTHADWLISVAGSTGNIGPVGPVGSAFSATASASATSLTLTHNFGTATHSLGPCIDQTTNSLVQGWYPSLPLGANSDTLNFPTALLHSTICYATSGGGGFIATDSTVVSASVITLTTFSTLVTGTTQINTITPPTGCTTSGTNCLVQMMADVSTGPFTLGTAGNISVAESPAAGGSVALVYRPSASLWYPASASPSSGGSVQIQNNGVAYGTSFSILNYAPAGYFGWNLSGSGGSTLTLTPTWNGPTYPAIHANPNFCGPSGGVQLFICSFVSTQALTAYSDGLEVTFRPDITTTSAAQLNIDGLGAKSIEDVTCTASIGTGMTGGQTYKLIYNNSLGVFCLEH